MSESTMRGRSGGERLELTSLDRVLFPDRGLTKGDVLAYYGKIASRMLPHIRGRPLNLERYRRGLHGEGFYQQQASSHFPRFVDRIEVDKHGGTVTHPRCESRKALLYLANQGTLTFHAWPSRAPDLERPDRVIFDLDPSEREFAVVRETARALHDRLEALGLRTHPMTTGSRGLHVVAAIRPEQPFEIVLELAKRIATELVDRAPDRLTLERLKRKRRGRLLVDVAQNSYGHATVAPYSVRARPDAPVAMPLRWDELDDPELDSQRFKVPEAAERVAAEGNPWQGMRRASIGRALDALAIPTKP